MVRTGQQWELAEPELNDRGQPIIHNIATLLGCIRPNADADLPPHSIFPEDEGGLSNLATELEAQQHPHMVGIKSETDSTCNRTERGSSSELDHSDFEQDYRKTMITNPKVQTLSPQSFTSYNDFDTNIVPNEFESTPMYPVQSTSNPAAYPPWNMARPTSINGLPPQFMQQMDMNMADIMLSQGVVESEFGTIKPHMLSCPNPEVMLGMGDPMMYSGYSMDALRP